MRQLVDALATARLVRLVTKDVIAEPLRDRWIIEAYHWAGRDLKNSAPPETMMMLDDDPPKLASLITCPWCTGVWIAFGVVALRRLAPRFWDPVATALAMSHLAGLGANLDVET